MDEQHYGPWAVITGGSEGVGASFALKLAESGLNLVLVARKPEPLEETAEAARRHGVEVRTLSLDLTHADAFERIRAATDGLEVGLLICNAGGNFRMGPYLDLEFEEVAAQIALNASGPARLAHHFGRAMRERRRGGIILIGSNASLAGAPNLATYCASKAFGATLAEALWTELKPFGVHVLGFSLGTTRTPTLIRAGARLDIPGYEAAEPDLVAQEGLDNIANGPIRHAAGTGATAQALRNPDRAAAVGMMGKGLG